MNQINASIITIGDELLIGQTIDTNSAFIAQELNRIGIWIKRRVAVGDVRDEILEALERESRDCQVVIITGGLGPTGDDITKPTLCAYFNSHLVVDPAALQNVKDIFARLNRPLIERNLKQAEVPHNCTVLPNKRGTAPGMWFEKDKAIYVSLPGVPNEMKGLMVDSVIPRLKQTLILPVVMHRTLVLAGKGESEIAELLTGFEANLPPAIKLAYLPAYGTIRLRLTGRSDNEQQLTAVIDELFAKLKPLVKEWMVAERDTTIQEAVLDLLKRKGKTLATAESCTGGYIAHLITSIAGSSAVYNGSIVSYANAVKERVLGVQANTLASFGAVSESIVKEMVQGALRTVGSDYAIATSGIMGPDGGTAEKPVGTVWIAVGSTHAVKAVQFHFRFDRARNIEQTAQMGLILLYRFISSREGE